MNQQFLISYDMQEQEITAFCFGSCKKISIGAIEVNNLVFLPCSESVCPHLDRQLTDEPFVTDEQGQNCFLRKLLPIDKEKAE